jgi:hypothetical protein
MQNSDQQSGRHFLQVPRPTQTPERILVAMFRQRYSMTQEVSMPPLSYLIQGGRGSEVRTTERLFAVSAPAPGTFSHRLQSNR